MATFKPRLTAPSTTDKNWINYAYGGYNYCIVENSTNGSVLPNCTGYAWGRWRELLGKKPNLSTNQAEVWYTRNDGYARGQMPKLGAIICWSKGDPKNYRDGAGHVAVVEEIKPDGTLVLSMSGAHSKNKFWTQELAKPYKYGTGYNLQGFIYLPIEYDTKTTYTGTFPTLPKRGYFYYKGSGSAVDKGEQVKNLQRFLNWAVNAGLTVDGKYGNATMNAVKKFQKAVGGIKIDGYFGKESLAKAKAFTK